MICWAIVEIWLYCGLCGKNALALPINAFSEVQMSCNTAGNKLNKNSTFSPNSFAKLWGSTFKGSRFKVQGFKIQGFNVQGFKVPRFKIQGFKIQGFKVQGFKVQGFKVQGFKVQKFKAEAPQYVPKFVGATILDFL